VNDNCVEALENFRTLVMAMPTMRVANTFPNRDIKGQTASSCFAVNVLTGGMPVASAAVVAGDQRLNLWLSEKGSVAVRRC
jgi:hypothetical protein